MTGKAGGRRPWAVIEDNPSAAVRLEIDLSIVLQSPQFDFLVTPCDGVDELS